MKKLMSFFALFLVFNSWASELIDRPINVFIMHGIIRESGHLGKFPKKLEGYLKSYFKTVNVYSFSIKGTGEKYKETSPTSIEGFVEDLKKDLFVNASKTPGDNHFIGLSMGGMIGMKWAELFPDDFKTFSIVNTSSSNDCGLFDRIKVSTYLPLIKSAIGSDETYEGVFVDLIVNNKIKRERTKKEWLLIRKKRPVRFSNTLRQIWAATQFKTSPKKPNANILFYVNNEDKLVHPMCTKNISIKWSAQLFESPTGGHDMFVDKPLWFSEHFKQALQKYYLE